MTMADRIAVMDHGRIVQIAPPQEIYEAPVSRYVAEFIGDVNLMEARVERSGGGVAVLRAGEGCTIEAASETPLDPGEDVAFIIRPEKMRLAAPTGAATANSVEGEVWDIAYLGDLSIYRIKLDDGPRWRAVRLNRVRAGEHPITWHDRVRLEWDVDAGVVLR